MSTMRLSLKQLNITAALIGAIGAACTGFGSGFVAGALAGSAAGLPIGKALWSGVATGGTAAVASVGNQIGGFLTQRTKGVDGTAPIFPSLESNDTAVIGAKLATDTINSELASTAPDPKLVELMNHYQQYNNDDLAAIATVIWNRQQTDASKANEKEISKLEQQLANLRGQTMVSAPAGVQS